MRLDVMLQNNAILACTFDVKSRGRCPTTDLYFILSYFIYLKRILDFGCSAYASVGVASE